MNSDALEINRISDGQGLSVGLLNYGARIASIEYSGHSLALAYPNIEEYLSDPFYLGATIGPITNRVANAQLVINGDTFHMPANEGEHCLHSGGAGFDKALWTVSQASSEMVEYQLEVDLSTVGLRGLLKTTARYSVNNGALKIDYSSECDTITFVNLTNHVYLNLSGHNEPITDHEFSLDAESFVKVDNESIPTGETTLIYPPMDYRLESRSPFAEFDGSVDHHFNSDSSQIVTARSLRSGIKLEVFSNAPGFQFYTGKFLGTPFKPSSGFCIEAQLAPNAINQPNFYSPILKPGERFDQRTTYKFST